MTDDRGPRDGGEWKVVVDHNVRPSIRRYFERLARFFHLKPNVTEEDIADEDEQREVEPELL